MRDADMDEVHALLNKRQEILHNSMSTQEQKNAINRAISVQMGRAVDFDRKVDALRRLNSPDPATAHRAAQDFFYGGHNVD